MLSVGDQAVFCVVQLQDVVGGARQHPFADDLCDASRQALPEAPGLLDLSEDRFGVLLAQPVATVSAAAFDAVAQPLGWQTAALLSALGGHDRLAVHALRLPNQIVPELMRG